MSELVKNNHKEIDTQKNKEIATKSLPHFPLREMFPTRAAAFIAIAILSGDVALGNSARRDKDNDVAAELDFSNQSCSDLPAIVSPNDAVARCAFAHTCNNGQGVILPFVFCGVSSTSGRQGRGWDQLSAAARTECWCALLSPLFLLWLVLLFRVLASTAEDFFAPSPEMLSRRLGLPPRFAGATLLALGNGAPDIGATVSAMTSDPRGGYLLSLGALTGAGMFVGTVVAGSVVVAAGGVPCRGAMVRDTMAYIIALLVVLAFLRTGRIGGMAVGAFFGLYFLYVTTVFVADVYHRSVVIPRLRNKAEEKALESMAEQCAIMPLKKFSKPEETEESTSQIDCSRSDAHLGSKGNHSELVAFQCEETDSNDLHGPELKFQHSLDSQESKRSLTGRLLSHFSNYDPKSLRLDIPILLHGPDGILAPHKHENATSQSLECDPLVQVVADNLDGIDRIVDEDKPPPGLNTALRKGIQDLRGHYETMWEEIIRDKHASSFVIFLRACEMPFTILRTVSPLLYCCSSPYVLPSSI